MKKIIALLLAVMMLALCAAGCSADTDGDTNTGDITGDTTDGTTGDADTSTDDDDDEGYSVIPEGWDTSSVLDEDPYKACSEGIGEDGHYLHVEIESVVTLPEYKGVTISADLLEADAETLNAQVQAILDENSEYEQLTDRAVEDGDTLNMDYVGYIDGVEFSGGNTYGAGTEVTIGVTQYIDDFLQQLIGHMPGETFDVEATFPDDYHAEDIAGKDAVFKVTINYIVGDRIDNELTEDIAKAQGYDSVDALLEGLKADIVEDQCTEFVSQIILQGTVTEVPMVALNSVGNEQVAMYSVFAAMYSMDVNTFLSTYFGYYNAEEFVDDQREYLLEIAEERLIRLAIAKAEGFEVTDEMITEYGYDSMKEMYGRPYAAQYVMIYHLVPEFILDNAVTE